MRTLAILMASISLVTTVLFVHALAVADEPSAPPVAQVAPR